MASRTDAHERALLIDGEWVTTGEWIDVASPYSGKTVGRVARGGRAEAEEPSTQPHVRSSRRSQRTSERRSSAPLRR